jgi:hypothetical protein
VKAFIATEPTIDVYSKIGHALNVFRLWIDIAFSWFYHGAACHKSLLADIITVPEVLRMPVGFPPMALARTNDIEINSVAGWN